MSIRSSTRPIKNRRRATVLLAASAVVLGAATAAGAVQKPGRTLVRSGHVRLVALNSASIAYAVGRTAGDCDHVELWDTRTKGTWRFGRPGPCTNLGSTGTDISAVAVTRNRAIWIRYTGGNTRDWQLLTATTTQRTPRLIRQISQDVDLPSPLAVGDSTGGGAVPYAAGRQVVLLGANGAAVFTHLEPAPVLAVTAGQGPGGAVVAALRTTGPVVLLRADGSVAQTLPFPPGAVTSMALAPRGLIVQVAGGVEIHRGAAVMRIALPAGTRMADFAGGRILYMRNGAVRALRVSDRQDTLLLTPGATGSYDTNGLAWARGTTINFACAGCIAYGP